MPLATSQLSFFDQTVQTPPNILDQIRTFDRFGRSTHTHLGDTIPYLANEYWTSGQRQAHAIHEISYRACFKAQLPEFFIERLTTIGQSVLDPFMGRGTTPIQAALMNRTALGNDINPLSCLLTRPRLSPVDLPQIARALQTIDWSDADIQSQDLLAFYHPATLRALEALKSWLNQHGWPHSSHVDPITDWIGMVALNRLSGHSPGFFSGRSMPPNQAISIDAQRKINHKHGSNPPQRDVPAIILKKSASLLRHGALPSAIPFYLTNGPAWNINLPDSSVDLVVTSPPFLDVVAYAADNWLRCWFAGIDPQSVAIDMHRNQKTWTNMVRRTLTELARLVRPDGHVAFEVGEIRNGKLLLERLVWAAADGLPFEKLCVMVNDQNFTKTSNCWGINNGTKGTNTNRIVLLKRH